MSLRSMTQVLRRFKGLERLLQAKGTFNEFVEVVWEYFAMGHTEPVPKVEVDSQHTEVYYFLMHAVHKEDSSTSKLRVIFGASAKTVSGTSLNNHLLVGPMVCPSLIDMLLQFGGFKVELTTDVRHMYQAVRLPDSQKDLHQFVWREDPQRLILDYRMTRLTFMVSASLFAANTALRKDVLNYSECHPQDA